MLIVGLVIFWIGMGLVITFKGLAPNYLLNPAAITLPLFTVIALLATCKGFRLFIKGINAAVSSKYAVSEEDRVRGAGLFRLLSKGVFFAGFAGLGLGVMAAFGHMDDVEALGHALAAGLVGYVIAFIAPISFFEPIAYVLRHRSAEDEQTVVYPKALGDKLLELAWRSGLRAEDIERATDISLRFGDTADAGARFDADDADFLR